MANTSLPNLTERTATANSDLIHVNSGGTDYKETKANFLSDVNASINSLNNSLTNSLVCTEIFRKLGVPTTPTAYACDWQNYNFLIISALQYGNVRTTIVMPYVEFYATSSGRRPQIVDGLDTSVQYAVYQNGSGSIIVVTNSTNSAYGISIYGVGRR